MISAPNNGFMIIEQMAYFWLHGSLRLLIRMDYSLFQLQQLLLAALTALILESIVQLKSEHSWPIPHLVNSHFKP